MAPRSIRYTTARASLPKQTAWAVQQREENMRLDGKIGLVTAAASGMGRAGALRFAREGAAVGIVDIDAAGVDAVVAEITSAGGRALALPGDLGDDDFARAIVRRTAGAFGGLDFVWNHVGHPGPASVEGIDMSDFDIAIALNLRTVLLTTEAAIPELRARGGGALLYTASTSGLVGSSFSPVYSMAKFGVVGFVRSLAKRLAPEKIRVNAICPGPIDTPMLRVFVARPDQQRTAGEDKEALVQARGRQNPMGRTGTPEEIANAALFLISDEASFVSGAALPVDGAATA
jgi:NAD(P)-dependent dehydrogenase (short-subunit alcohol dehydrogenase family)